MASNIFSGNSINSYFGIRQEASQEYMERMIRAQMNAQSQYHGLGQALSGNGPGGVVPPQKPAAHLNKKLLLIKG